MTFLGHEAVLKISYQPNIKRFTTQAILVIFVGFCLSYDKHMQIQNKREKDKTIHQDDLESSSDDDCKEEEENSEQSKNYFGYSLWLIHFAKFSKLTIFENKNTQEMCQDYHKNLDMSLFY